MTDHLTSAAVLAAEIGLDLLEIAIRDAGDLEAVARAFVVAILANEDSIGCAYQVAASAAELEAKLRKMADEFLPRLGEVIVAHRDDDAMAVH